MLNTIKTFLKKQSGAMALTALLSACQPNQTISFETFGARHDKQSNSSEAAVKLAKYLEQQNGEAPKTIVLPKGQYHFYEENANERTYYISNHDQVNPKRVAFALENLKNVTIDGQGSELIFHGRMLPIALIDCENVTLNNFSIDFEPPHLRQITVESIDLTDQSLICRLIPEGNYSLEGNKLKLTGPGYETIPYAAMPFNSNGRLAYGRADLDFSKASVEEISPNKLRVRNFQLEQSSLGDQYVLRTYYRPNPAIFMSHSRNTKFENVKVHYAEGMGLLAQLCENIHLDGFSVCLKTNDERCFTTQADATHFSGCKGVILSENGLYEGMADDAINVHGTYLKVVKRINPTTLVGRYMHDQSWGFSWGMSGDTIQLVQSATMEVCQSHNRIKSIKPVDTDSDHGAREFEIELEQAIPEMVDGETAIGIENLTWTPQVVFRNNTIRNNRARGALFSTPRRVVCEGNLFDHTHGSAILLCGDCNGWYETGACREVIIRNNQFINALTAYYQFTNAVISIYPEIPDLQNQQQFFHSGIVIENNLFKMFDRPLLYAKSVENLRFSNNKIENNQDFAPFHWNQHLFFMEHVKNIIIKNNTFDQPFDASKDIRVNQSEPDAIEVAQ